METLSPNFVEIVLDLSVILVMTGNLPFFFSSATSTISLSFCSVPGSLHLTVTGKTSLAAQVSQAVPPHF